MATPSLNGQIRRRILGLPRLFEEDKETRMISTFVISLPDSTDRRAAISRRLVSLGVAFEFVDAVDGRDGLPSEFEPMIDRLNGLKEDGSSLLEVEFACSLSHIRVCRIVVERKLPHALIFEDDAIPGPDLPNYISGRHLGDADLTLLGFHSAWIRRRSARRLFNGYRSLECAPGTAATGAFGYIVSRAAAAHIVKNAVPVNSVADWPKCMDFFKQQATFRLVSPGLVDHLGKDQDDSIITKFGRQYRQKRRLWGVYVPPMRVIAKSWMLRIFGPLIGLKKIKS